MIKEVTVRNIENGKAVTIGTDAPYILMEIVWDAPAVSLNSYRVPHQIGETYGSVVVGTRSPAIYGVVVSGPVEGALGMEINEYYRQQEVQIEESKRALDAVMSLFQEIELMANGYLMRVQALAPPKYSTQEKENNEVLCMFSLNFSCLSSVFLGEKKSYELSSIENRFHFPLVLPPEGMIFGVVHSTNTIHLVNSGEMKTGLTIVIDAVGGSVSNPEIRNAGTQEFIKIETVVEKDTILTIQTATGEEIVTIYDTTTGEEVNGVGYVSYDSTFLQAEIGENVFTLGASGGTADNARVSIEIQMQYFNIRGM